MSISDIVKVNITREVPSTPTEGFGTALLLGEQSEKGDLSDAEVHSLTKATYAENVASGEDAVKHVYGMLDNFFNQASTLGTIPVNILVGFKQAAEDTDAALTRLNNLNKKWYALMTSDATLDNQKKASEWVESNKKLCVLRTAEAASKGTATTDIGAVLKAADRKRSITIYHSKAASEYADGSTLGKVLPAEIGQSIWFGRTLDNITPDNLTATEIQNLKDKNINYYTEVVNSGLLREGVVATGAYIDLQRSEDWLVSQIQSAIFDKLIANNKVPYTQEGIQMIGAELNGVFSNAVGLQVLTNNPEPTVSLPRIEDIPQADISARILKINFRAQFAGAVQGVNIEGTIVA